MKSILPQVLEELKSQYPIGTCAYNTKVYVINQKDG